MPEDPDHQRKRESSADELREQTQYNDHAPAEHGDNS